MGNYRNLPYDRQRVRETMEKAISGGKHKIEITDDMLKKAERAADDCIGYANRAQTVSAFSYEYKDIINKEKETKQDYLEAQAVARTVEDLCTDYMVENYEKVNMDRFMDALSPLNELSLAVAISFAPIKDRNFMKKTVNGIGEFFKKQKSPEISEEEKSYAEMDKNTKLEDIAPNFSKKDYEKLFEIDMYEDGGIKDPEEYIDYAFEQIMKSWSDAREYEDKNLGENWRCMGKYDILAATQLIEMKKQIEEKYWNPLVEEILHDYYYPEEKENGLLESCINYDPEEHDGDGEFAVNRLMEYSRAQMWPEEVLVRILKEQVYNQELEHAARIVLDEVYPYDTTQYKQDKTQTK